MAQTINSFLGRFKKILQRGVGLQETIIEAIKKHTGVTLKRDVIRIQGGVIYITTDPMVKSEIFLHQDEILTDINTKSDMRLTQIR